MPERPEAEIEPTESRSIDVLPRWLRDLIECNLEASEQDAGRLKRFTPRKGEAGHELKKAEEEHWYQALLRSLQEPEYVRLYRQAWDAVELADEAVRRALKKLEGERLSARERLEDLLDSAVTLADGRKVFQSEDGRWHSQDGQVVPLTEVSSFVDHRRRQPSWEEFLMAKSARDHVERRQQEIDSYREDVLEPARGRLQDKNTPPTSEDVKQIIERTRAKMPPDVLAVVEDIRPEPHEKRERGAAASVAEQHVGPTSLDVPDLFAKFRAASAATMSGEVVAPIPGLALKP